MTEANLNEYGRFEKLVKSVDDDKAKKYLEQAQGVGLSIIGYRTRLSTVLKEFLISGGKGEKIPRIEKPKVMEAEWLDADASYVLNAAEGETSDAN